MYDALRVVSKVGQILASMERLVTASSRFFGKLSKDDGHPGSVKRPRGGALTLFVLLSMVSLPPLKPRLQEITWFFLEHRPGVIGLVSDTESGTFCAVHQLEQLDNELETRQDTQPNLASKRTIWQPAPEHQQNSLDIKERYHAKAKESVNLT